MANCRILEKMSELPLLTFYQFNMLGNIGSMMWQRMKNFSEGKYKINIDEFQPKWFIYLPVIR